MAYRQTIDATSYVFDDLRDLLAKATPPRSGDRLAGIAADSAEQMVAARMALADLPLRQFLNEAVIPYEDDEVTRLIVDSHDASAFAPVASMTVGAFRDFLLSDAADSAVLARLARGLTPEMAAAVSKLMRNQDLIAVAKKCEVTTRFRNTIGLQGRMSTRLQPNHPFDDARGITASILDGMLLGAGDACIGINPASDDPAVIAGLLRLLDDIIGRLDIPTQGCVLTHVTTTLGFDCARRPGRSGVPVGCRHRGRQPQFWRQPRAAARGARGGAVAEARHDRRQRDVFRDRAGLGAVGQCPSRRRPADLRGPRLCGGARLRSAAGQQRGRLHRPGISLRRQGDHPRRPRGSFLRQAARRCRWASTSATPTMPRPTRTTWTIS